MTASEPPPPARCTHCGAPAPADGPPLTWTCSVERGERHYTCGDCARAHLRSIESRLDPAWW
ncbi:hypothetical protein ACN20G_07175 [Streptomyces sp. BI20]|uniref:hypothetical protein n=1 Tax=Streptomyces sp. BI20 TaxID=3403460 RepID=UPI003C770D47